MSTEFVKPDELTPEEIQDSIEYWEIYAFEANVAKDRKEFDKATGHIVALKELLRKQQRND